MKKRIISLAACAVIIINIFCLFSFAEDENLALGKNVTLGTGVPVSASYGNYPGNFDTDPSLLTDGKRGSEDTLDGAYMQSFRGYSRIATVDLGEVCDINRVVAGFFHSKNSAYYMPRFVKVSLSEDGENYMTVAEVQSPYPLSDGRNFRVEYAATFECRRARFVRVEYASDIFVACDEIEVFGGTGGKPITPDEAKEYAPIPDSLDGAGKIIKIYNGYYPEQAIGDNTYDELLPYIAYLNKKGEIEDVMFDGLAFVPCHTDYPSGGRLVKTNGKNGAVKSDWDLYLDNTFAEGINLSALDKVVGDVYEKLGITGTFPVLLTMPYPTVIEGEFGDINGDHLPEYCSTYDERWAIVKHYADEYTSRFASAGYKNLRLSGFYWYREEVNISETDHEDKLVMSFNEYAHSLGLVTLYDPFFLSMGFDSWRELGFDACVMQPNYAERYSDREYYKDGMLTEFTWILPDFACGVELETVSQGGYVGSDYMKYVKNYLEYLTCGAKFGYDKVINTFYQGGGPGTLYDFCHADTTTSRGAILRGLYDRTYLYLSGKLTTEAPVLTGETEFELQSGKRLREGVTVEDSDSLSYELTLNVVKAPEHGKISTTGYDGYVYKPDDGFVGTDSFILSASDGLNESNELTVKVNVIASDESEEPEISSESSSPDSAESTEAPQDNEKGLGILPFVIGAAVVIIAAAAVIIIRRKRNVG